MRSNLSNGLKRGFKEFVKAIHEIDAETRNAGQGLGGIFGKRASQAITPENQVAEFYDPVAHHEKFLKRLRNNFPKIVISLTVIMLVILLGYLLARQKSFASF